jgi:hypothetical protein
MSAVLGSTWAVQIPVMAVCVRVLHWGAPALWLTMIFSNVLFLAIMVAWFKVGRWKSEGARCGARLSAGREAERGRAEMVAAGARDEGRPGTGPGFADAD